MITSTRRVSADKPEVQIAFSLDETSELKDAEDPLPSFPDLEQRLQPVLPCRSLKESIEVYRNHYKMANEFNQVKHEITRLEDRKRELMAELLEDEKVSMEFVQLEEEYRILTEENQNLITVHSQRAQQARDAQSDQSKEAGLLVTFDTSAKELSPLGLHYCL